MQTEVLRVLRTEAQSWWRHRELRRTGDLDAAHRLERQTILRDLGYLRTAINNPNAYVSCGGGGTILHLGLTTVSLYAPVERFPLADLGDPAWNASDRLPSRPRHHRFRKPAQGHNGRRRSIRNLGRPQAVYRS